MRGEDGRAHQAGHHVQRLSRYLTKSDADRFLGDMESFARRRPWSAGGIGVAVGFVASRFLKASSESRYQSSRRTDADLPISRDAGSF